MKQFKSLLLAATLFTALLTISGCDKDTTSDQLRDVTITASVTGDFSQSIDFTLESGTANAQGIGVSASRSSIMNKLSINIIGSATWGLVLSADATSIATGSYPLAGGFTTYYNTGASANQFLATGGTMQITSAESTSPLGTANDRYVSGTFHITMQNTDNPPMSVTINGTFTNVCMIGS